MTSCPPGTSSADPRGFSHKNDKHPPAAWMRAMCMSCLYH